MFSFAISIVVNIGMWFERFVIIVTSLHRDYLPSSWTMFSPTFVDIGIFIGTVGFFFVLFLLYARTFPVIAQAEVKTILKSSGESYKKIRERGDSLVGTGADERTSSSKVKNTKKEK
jgi:molybdopterin-containing oxidoreductase family membrane subunit